MICDICTKRRLVGHRVSHSNVKTKKQQRPNIKKLRVMLEGRCTRRYVCTRCIRSGRIFKKPHRNPT